MVSLNGRSRATYLPTDRLSLRLSEWLKTDRLSSKSFESSSEVSPRYFLRDFLLKVDLRDFTLCVGDAAREWEHALKKKYILITGSNNLLNYSPAMSWR